MDAVRDDDRELVSKTLEAGEDVTQTNAYLRTPLHKAAYYSGAPEVESWHFSSSSSSSSSSFSSILLLPPLRTLLLIVQ
jgi:hypothetical protein